MVKRVAKQLTPVKAGRFSEIGIAGLRQATGYLWEEYLPQLRGEQGRRIYREMALNDATVGAVLGAISLIIRGVQWKVNPANDSAEAGKEAEFAESLLKDMSHSWEDFISEALTMLQFGWSYFEIVMKRRVGPLETAPEKRSKFDDGLIGLRKLAPRAQDTLQRWEMQDDGGIDGMWQQPPMGGGLRFLPIERSLLFRTVSNKNSPEGISVLRTAYTSWYALKNIEQFEAIGIERELAGLPVISIPSDVLNSDAPADILIKNAYEKMARDLKMNEQAGVVIPSDTFENRDGTLSGVKKVSVELLSSAGSRTIDTNTVVQRKQHGIARACLADFIMLGESGAGASRGSYGMSESKMDFFIRACETLLRQITYPLNSFMLPRIWDINGKDRDLIPEYTAGRLVKADLVKIGTFLKDLTGAGAQLFPDDELENRLRIEADLPEKSAEAIQQQKDQQAVEAEMKQQELDAAKLKAQGGGAPDPGGKGSPQKSNDGAGAAAIAKAGWDESQHPRAADGKFGESAVGTPAMEELQRRINNEKRLQGYVDKAAKDLGWEKPIRVAPYGEKYPFTINGQNTVAGGVYSSVNDEITIYAETMGSHPEDDVRGVVAHEIQHARWARAWKAYEVEKYTMQGDPEFLDDENVGPGGGLSTKFKAKYPLVNMLQKFDNPYSRSQLAKQDGVSDYSTQYWAEYEKAKRGESKFVPEAAFKQASNETLAEIARIRFQDKGRLLNPNNFPSDKPLWRRFAYAINEAYKRYVSQYGQVRHPGSVHL